MRSPQHIRLVAAVLTAGLTIAATSPAGADRAAGSGSGFSLGSASVHPHQALFAGKRKPTLRYRFRARERRVDLRIVVRDVRRDRIVAAWKQRDAKPRQRLKRPWNGVTRRGKAAPDGRYEFRVGARGGGLAFAARFRLRGHVFPVDGPHGDRGPIGDFGAPRSGGRTHEGFDITGACGTPLVAVRGGKVRKAGYDPQLYGYFVLIEGRKSSETYFYSHLVAPSSARRGDRVRTGERVGRIGQTGNAAGTPCHLHFQLTRSGALVDPEPRLRDWDD